jgi:dUTP pyrophosphatase
MTMQKIDVAVQTLPHFEGLRLPQYESDLAAGVDLQAAIDVHIELPPGARDLIPTGICIALPAGYEAQIRPRSGLAIKHGITCLNTPGTIDADYRGEIKVILANLGHEVFVIERGMRIAQMIVAPVQQLQWQVCDSLDETIRGSSGFGSTGVTG